MSLGKRIRDIRQSKALTQSQVSNRTGLAVPYLSRIENDHIEPCFSTLQKISEALDVNLVDFFGYDQQKKFKEKCPVSLSGRCIAERIYAPGRKGIKLSAESYSTKQIQLLQLANYLVLFGNRKIHESLELLFLALIKSTSVKKDREWLSNLMRTNG